MTPRRTIEEAEVPAVIPTPRKSNLVFQIGFLAVFGAVISLPTPVAHGKVVFVNAGQTNSSRDGLTWATAFTNVQQAIDGAASGDQVWVAAAAYFENIALKEGIALYGGFKGVETDLSERNWTTNVSVLDGRETDSVIVVAAGATNTTRIDGFVIRNGKATSGGGILCSNASPVIANNALRSNTATSANGLAGGAGIYCALSWAMICNNRFLENAARTDGGGGIACAGSSPTILSNTFVANVASYSSRKTSRRPTRTA